MSLEPDDYKWLDAKFTEQSKALEGAISRIVLDYKERIGDLGAKVSQLESSDKYQTRKLQEMELMAKVKGGESGAKEGKRQGVKWSVILALSLNALIKIIELIKDYLS